MLVLALHPTSILTGSSLSLSLLRFLLLVRLSSSCFSMSFQPLLSICREQQVHAKSWKREKEEQQEYERNCRSRRSGEYENNEKEKEEDLSQEELVQQQKSSLYSPSVYHCCEGSA